MSTKDRGARAAGVALGFVILISAGAVILAGAIAIVVGLFRLVAP